VLLPRRLDVNVQAEQAKSAEAPTAAPRPPQPASAGFCCWAWRFSAGRGRISQLLIMDTSSA